MLTESTLPGPVFQNSNTHSPPAEHLQNESPQQLPSGLPRMATLLPSYETVAEDRPPEVFGTSVVALLTVQNEKYIVGVQRDVAAAMVQSILAKEESPESDPEDEWFDADSGPRVGDAAMQFVPPEPTPSSSMDTACSHLFDGSFDPAAEDQAHGSNPLAEDDSVAKLQDLVGKLVRASSLQAAEIERLSAVIQKNHSPPRLRSRVHPPSLRDQRARRRAQDAETHA